VEAVSTLDNVSRRTGGSVTSILKVWFDIGVVAVCVDARDDVESLIGITGTSETARESLFVLKYDGVDETVFASPLTVDTEALILILDATIDTATSETVDMLGLKLDVSTLDIVCDGGFVTDVPKVWFDNVVVAIGVDATDELVSLGGMIGRSVNTKEALYALVNNGVEGTVCASPVIADTEALILTVDA